MFREAVGEQTLLMAVGVENPEKWGRLFSAKQTVSVHRPARRPGQLACREPLEKWTHTRRMSGQACIPLSSSGRQLRLQSDCDWEEGLGGV